MKTSNKFVRAESLVIKLPNENPYSHVIGYKELLELIKEGFFKLNDLIGPDYCHDVESILDVLKTNPHLKLYGKLRDKTDSVYFTCDNIQGFKQKSKKFTLRQQLDFAICFRYADELLVDDQNLYAWFD